MPVTGPPGLRSLVPRLDAAVGAPRPAAVSAEVKAALQDTVGRGDDALDPAALRPSEGRYARRLLHRDPAGRYSVVAMVWGPGQGTDLHDHGGRWCVECVYRGDVTVTSYALTTPPDADPLGFRVTDVVRARPGDAGALIPPFEYHRIENRGREPAVTVHVYGGELLACDVFLPVPGGWRRERRTLGYTP